MKTFSRVRFPTCKQCTTVFSAHEQGLARYCSDGCRLASRLASHPRRNTPEWRAYMRAWEANLSPERRQLRKERQLQAGARRRALKRGAMVEWVCPADIYKRDGWRCYLCGELIDRKVPSTHPLSATLDHVIPLSKGGEHSAANLRAAHRLCNTEKGTTIGPSKQYEASKMRERYNYASSR